MHFLLSGEGPTDIGACKTPAAMCFGSDFHPGPMTAIVDKLVQNDLDYSILEVNACTHVSKQHLGETAKKLRSFKLPRKRDELETGYFFKQARALAQIAKDQATNNSTTIIAILFHDADSKVSFGRGEWQSKYKAILDGFSWECFSHGVPMVPQPISEAWLICGLNKSRYPDCGQLETRSKSKLAKEPLKKELEKLLGEKATAELLTQKVQNEIDIDQINMPSFNVFKERLHDAITS